MTDWVGLAEPFPDEEIKQRPGRGGMTFSYIDARAVAQRLDDTVGPGEWEFTCSVIPGSDIVKGHLAIRDGDRWVVREDHGYPNSDQDDEPIKAATSDALKRCAVLFGIGRHLYGDNKPAAAPARPAPARPAPARPAPVRSSTDVPDDPYGDTLDELPEVHTTVRSGSAPWVCPLHGTSKTVPAGVSKKPPYKPYDAFLACTEYGCNEKPPKVRAA